MENVIQYIEGHRAAFEQDLAELLPRLPLDLERDPDLALGKEAALDEDRADQACGEALRDAQAPSIGRPSFGL